MKEINQITYMYMYLWWNMHCAIIKHNSCFICFWGLYGQHNLQHGQLMTTEAKRWIYFVSNIRPTSPLWADLRCSNVCFQPSANVGSTYYIIGTMLGICLIYFDSNIGPTSPLWAELQSSANDPVDVGSTLRQHVLVC